MNKPFSTEALLFELEDKEREIAELRTEIKNAKLLQAMDIYDFIENHDLILHHSQEAFYLPRKELLDAIKRKFIG